MEQSGSQIKSVLLHLQINHKKLGETFKFSSNQFYYLTADRDSLLTNTAFQALHAVILYQTVITMIWRAVCRGHGDFDQSAGWTVELPTAAQCRWPCCLCTAACQSWTAAQSLATQTLHRRQATAQLPDTCNTTVNYILVNSANSPTGCQTTDTHTHTHTHWFNGHPSTWTLG